MVMGGSWSKPQAAAFSGTLQRKAHQVFLSSRDKALRSQETTREQKLTVTWNVVIHFSLSQTRRAVGRGMHSQLGVQN